MPDEFKGRVQRQIERLKTSPCREIERQVAQKRIAWFRERRSALGGLDRPTPRRAYELLFFEYIGLSPRALPVVAESETEIAWLSRFPCPTLEACHALSDILHLPNREI